MEKVNKLKEVFNGIYYSFPMQLLLNHFKKNQIFLLIWFILFAFITQNAGNMFGVPYLFLDPEYMNHTGPKGFFILGVAIGILIMSFHITTYILDSYRFSFLGGVARPFTKFCINNSIIPALFVITYIYCIIKFQTNSGYQTPATVMVEIIAFLGGISITISIMFSYFWSTNKDIFKFLASNLDLKLKRNSMNRVNVMKKLRTIKREKYLVTSYIDLPICLKKVPEYSSFDKNLLLKVFDQNHLNAVFVELFIIILIIVLGIFRELPYFQIPAGASATIFFAIIIMFTGAFSYWLRGWAITALILILVSFNLLVRNEFIKIHYQAYGLDYTVEPVEYSTNKLTEISQPHIVQKDFQETIKILENWKAKFPPREKPKMVFICTSGGGQRAAVWTTRTLQHADSLLHGKLLKHSTLITGASGGIIGASYYRELYWQKLKGHNINLSDNKYFDNISKDMLNPIIFSMVVNDFFVRFQKFKDGDYTYIKDRGYAFEHQLNYNTDYVLDKRIRDYYEPEKQGLIPILLMSPTVINDGRKLYISSQNMSYMTTTASTETKQFLNQKIKGIEFKRLFKEQDSENLKFSTALRMSATFPYITPNVELPSSPVMEIMDAGLSDNFGIRDAVQFLHVFRDWIKQNTSGVIILAIRDSEKEAPIEKPSLPSIFTKWLSPIGSLYNNWDYLQDFNNDNILEHAQTWFEGDMHVIDFQYIPKPKVWNSTDSNAIIKTETELQERAALSWHLTTREKESLKRTILEENNQASLIKLKNLLNSPE